MRGFYCIAFIEYILTGKTLLDYTNLFSPKNYEKNDNIIYIFRTNTSCLEFRFKKIDETKNDLLDEINHNDLMSEKYKNTYKYLNYVHFLILASIITDCVSISSFAFLSLCSCWYYEFCSRTKNSGNYTAGIKKYKSIIKKKKKKHDKIVLLGKDKINTIEVLISKALIDSYISHDEFVSVNNVKRECNEMKEETKKS